MYTLLTTLSWRRFAIEQVPVLATAMLIAERFYTFHSFTLECAAFLATWHVLDRGAHALRSWRRPESAR